MRISTLGLAMILVMPLSGESLAQSYPGLVAPIAKPDAAVAEAPRPGYGGLTAGTARAQQQVIRLRPAATPEKEAQPQTEQTAAAQSHALNPSVLKSSSALGKVANRRIIETPQDLKIAALLEKHSPVGESAIKARRLSEETLEIVNKPAVKDENGMWPKEARIVNYLKMVFKDIAGLKGEARRDKIAATRWQVETLIDANLARMATPERVSLQMGLTPRAVAENKAVAEASNKQLNAALKHLRY